MYEKLRKEYRDTIIISFLGPAFIITITAISGPLNVLIFVMIVVGIPTVSIIYVRIARYLTCSSLKSSTFDVSSNELILGEIFEANINLKSTKRIRVKSVVVELCCVEMEKEGMFKYPLPQEKTYMTAQTTLASQVQLEAGKDYPFRKRFQIPPVAMHSFAHGLLEVKWTIALIVKTRLAFKPKEEMPLQVLPLKKETADAR